MSGFRVLSSNKNATNPKFKTVPCRDWCDNNRRCPRGNSCWFAHGDDLRTYEGHVGEPKPVKTTMCRYQVQDRVCFKGPKCKFSHSKDEHKAAVREYQFVNVHKYKTEFCNSVRRGGDGRCKLEIWCHFVHRDDPEYDECLRADESELVPVEGLTIDDRYDDYVEAVVSPVLPPLPHGRPTHLPSGRTAELVDIAMANGMTKDVWFALNQKISEKYEALKILDSTISEFYDDPSRPRVSQEIAKAKRDRLRIDSELIDEVKTKINYLNIDQIDLHGLRKPRDAIVLLKERIEQIIRNPEILPKRSLRPRTLTIITGAGTHSVGDAAIRDEVKRFLEARELRFNFILSTMNEGCFIITFDRQMFID
ncbi:hypothetical protein PENTCL1PPCAC_7373 [Pristionchus entomophagus]|uniref:Uncharacterized protein n=1 Tax=Pristionchus entomophagus TaxID=358040 RepID=A0AAV5SX76_9BILA|nr:hypothetical protein PENTCL1PPCAC_7373 [Pristionchus entomophagus]